MILSGSLLVGITAFTWKVVLRFLQEKKLFSAKTPYQKITYCKRSCPYMPRNAPELIFITAFR